MYDTVFIYLFFITWNLYLSWVLQVVPLLLYKKTMEQKSVAGKRKSQIASNFGFFDLFLYVYIRTLELSQLKNGYRHMISG